MSKKQAYHMGSKGPALCDAKSPASCPLGGRHFFSQEKAQKYFESTQTPSPSIRKKAPKRRSNPRLRTQLLGDAPRVKSPKKRVLVLADVDGTLVKGSLVLDHAVELHRKGVLNLGDLPERWLADPKNEELITELAVAYRDSLKDMTPRSIDPKGFVERTIADPEKFYSALEKLVAHKQAGHDVVLISGSPGFLIQPFAEHFGFKGIGSTYHTTNRRFNGRVTGMFGAQAKEAVLETLHPQDYDTVYGYGDTSSDIPLLKRAHHAVLVDPTASTLERVKSEGIEPEVLRR